jgi:hypothetical protein
MCASRCREITGISKVRQSVNTNSLPIRLLRRAEAAQHIYDKWGYPCSPRTLAKYAVIGGGPPFRKAGRYPLYHPDDLDGWVGGKLSNLVTSTSELIKKAESIESAPVNTGSAPKAHAGRASNPDSEDDCFVGSMMGPVRRRNANAR